MNITCDHDRPYRFYGKTIDIFYLDALNNHNLVDPITADDIKTGMGYPLSVESGKTLDDLNKQYEKDKECHIIGSTCTPVSVEKQSSHLEYSSLSSVDAILDGYEGSAQCKPGTWLCSTITLGQQLSKSQRTASTATATPTEASWLVTSVTTTEPVNTLRFSYRFVEGGEGFLRVFVNENTVREIDQRYVPPVSTEPESIYIGELPAGTYKIAFRLDGYGASPSGIELTGVELGLETLVEDSGYTLTTFKAGTGTGTVTGTGINCGSDCTESYASGTAITLTATPASGSTFAGWSGACSGSSTCTVTMDIEKSVTATFNIIPDPGPAPDPTYTLTVNAAGTGTGVVTGGGSYLAGATVTLTATADANSTFTGWSPAPCAASFPMPAQALTCTATFTLNSSYTVTATAGANGTITPASQTVNHGATTTFTVTPDTGYSAAVTGCGGALNGTTYTTGPISTACTVSATFSANHYTVSATAGTNGTITPASQTVNHGATTTFTVTPDTGYSAVVTGCEGTLNGTTYTTGPISEACTVTAHFTTIQHTLTAEKVGAGDGTVVSIPTGIDCGSACATRYAQGTVITLMALPDSDSLFAGWTPTLCGTPLTLSADTTCTAHFILNSAANDRDHDGIPDPVELQEGSNPDLKDNDVFANARFFVMQQYRDFLQREGEDSGIEYLTGQLQNGATTRTAIIQGYLASPEFGQTVSPVARLYFAYFNRIPDTGGLNYWIEQYRAGSGLDTISQAFASSPEFQQTYGALSHRDFAILVYRNVLGREPDNEGLNFWVEQLNSGAFTRGQLMVGFSESPEYRQMMNNKIMVTLLYLGMLQRAPEAGGFDYWVEVLDSGQSSAGLIDHFLHSNEYYQRFLP